MLLCTALSMREEVCHSFEHVFYSTELTMNSRISLSFAWLLAFKLAMILAAETMDSTVLSYNYTGKPSSLYFKQF